jgi:hypothetical protein
MRLKCEDIVRVVDEALLILGKGNESRWRGVNLPTVKLYCSLLND